MQVCINLTMCLCVQKQGPDGAQVQLKHQLLQVIVRVLQYRMLLTDYLNNLSPDSKEYEDTQAALVIVSEVADQANENLKQGVSQCVCMGVSVCIYFSVFRQLCTCAHASVC
uniref:DH domain-containing protein n=1 Tax=Hucho hucho TaxID=62062 RepID=A0A4W5NK53_9TELE